jgi:3-phosphoshikimate 1-carboxyvinyltransferase
MEQLTLPAAHRAEGTVKLPGSKSISNRTLLLAALADGVTEIRDLLASDDTSRMLEALEKLGVKLEKLSGTDWKVTGCGGNFPNKGSAEKPVDLFLGNAGTAFRPLTAALALSDGYFYLHGVPRMHERPIGDLVDALRQIGANIEYLENAGFPPLRIAPAHLPPPPPAPLKGEGVIKIRGDVSSQFLTALLMALPLSKRESVIEVVGELISKPYIEITLNLMAKFGVVVKREGWQKFIIAANSNYVAHKQIFVEGDASSASYFLAAGAIAGNVTVEGLGKNSIQGDIKFAEALALMGTNIEYGANNACSARLTDTGLQSIDLDCNHIPDAAMTLAIMALFAEGTTTLRNIASWRVKETDRIAAMSTELRKVGAIVEEGADYIKITPPAKLTPNAVIDTYDDHRMAMCFSLVSLGGVPITINDPKCVAKTFPDYFAQFAKIAK